MSDTTLSTLRSRIDRTDDQIVELLAQRFALTEAVGILKAGAGLAAVDAAREQEQQTRLQALAESKGVNPTVVLRVFRVIVDEVIANHQAVAQKALR